MDADGFLPEPIIQQVLSFLPLRQVMKVALVCKSWSRACSSLPTLDFDFRDFVGDVVPGEAPGRFMKRLERMVEFIDGTMMRFQEQSLRIDKFRFRHVYYGKGAITNWTHALDKWIGIALDNNVGEITIVNAGRNVPYLISERILSAPTVYSMKLVGGGLAPSSSYWDASINLKSLTSLVLGNFSMDDWMLERLVNECKSLEFLSVQFCNSLKEIRVSGPRNIKTVDLLANECTRLVEIEAPSLECFRCSYFSLVGSRMLVLNHSPNLRSLTLFGVGLTDEWLGELLSRLPSLEDLSVACCSSLMRTRILNPSVKRIVINGCSNLIDIKLETPELRSFQLELYDGILPSISSESRTHHSCDANVSIDYIDGNPQGPFDHLRAFLMMSIKVFASLSLQVWIQKTCFRIWKMDIENKGRWSALVEGDKSQLLQSPPDIRTLSRKVEDELSPAIDPTDYSFILTCQPNTVIFVAGLSGDGFLEYFFEKLASRKPCFADVPEHWLDRLEYKKIIQTATGSNCEAPLGNLREKPRRGHPD